MVGNLGISRPTKPTRREILNDAGIFVIEEGGYSGTTTSGPNRTLPDETWRASIVPYNDHAALNTAFTIVLWLLIASLALNIWLLIR